MDYLQKFKVSADIKIAVFAKMFENFLLFYLKEKIISLKR